MAKVKSKRGRPVSVWTPEHLKEVEKKIIKYTDETDCPIIAEFAYQSNILREQLYQYPELTYSIKRLINKKETYLERYGLEKNNTMAIFSLKQLGWKDNQDSETTQSQKITIKLPSEFGN